MKSTQRKGAGRKTGTGNVTIDLGEEIDRKLRATGMAGRSFGSGINRAGIRRFGGGLRRFGGYRPGMFGVGARTWYPSYHGTQGRWALGDALGIPTSINTGQTLIGSLLGIVGSRALVRVTPEIIKTDSRLAHEAIAFTVGLVPLMVKRNSVTIGVALPGFVFLGATLVDMGLDALGVKKPVLQGTRPQVGSNPAAAARQRLADIQSRIQPQRQSPLPRVVAQRV